MKKIVCTLMALFALAACNTIHGLGKDVQALGGAMQDASKK